MVEALRTVQTRYRFTLAQLSEASTDGSVRETRCARAGVRIDTLRARGVVKARGRCTLVHVCLAIEPNVTSHTRAPILIGNDLVVVVGISAR